MCTQFGAVIDSIADFTFCFSILAIFIPLVRLPIKIVYWIVAIIIIKILSLIVGGIRYKALAFLHTYANKFTGFIVFCFPILYMILGGIKSVTLICIIAILAALEELLINLKEKKLDRDIHSIFKT